MAEKLNMLLIKAQKEIITKAIDNLRELQKLSGRSYDNEINEMLDRLITLKELEAKLKKKK